MSQETWFFLRGLVRESAHWSGFLEEFARAYPERRVVALDIPGNGKRFREASPVSIEAMAEAARADYLRERGEKNFLFAISLGAMTGLAWMSRHPQDFDGAVLVNTSLRGLSPLHHRLRPANWGTILSLLLKGDPLERERKILEMTSQRPENVQRWAQIWTEIQRQRPVSKQNALRQLLAAIRFSPPKEKPRPALLIMNGARDTLVDPRCSMRLAELWNSRILVNPDAGHDLTLDAPAWVIEQLKAPFSCD